MRKKCSWARGKIPHGEGTWSFPGGHLEFNEEIEHCARREVEEETAISIENIRYAIFTNDIFKQEEKHYVTLFVVCDHREGEARVKEPYKCEKWRWFEWDNLPSVLIPSHPEFVKTKFNPFITRI